MNSHHIDSIQIVANGLDELLKDIVFVGGAVAELYAKGPGSAEVRVSDDIDCVIEIGSRREYRELELSLEIKGFQHDNSPNAPVCRWQYKEILIDIMPTKADILGFSNKWYPSGIKNKISYILPNGSKIYIFPPELYLASKFEAFNHRAGTDLRQSHDFEDIIYVLDNNPEILTVLGNCPEPVKGYLKSQFRILAGRDDISEGIECALPFGAESDNVEKILDILQFK